MNIANDVDIQELSEKTDGCSGAEIAALCQDAGINAMYDNINAINIEKKHFDKALMNLVKHTTLEMIDFYKSFNHGHLFKHT